MAMEKQQDLGDLFSIIADELNISDSMMKKAVNSYEAVGKWIGDGVGFNVCIMPQGSMNLGTVIRPIDDSDDYDIDLVCLLKNGNGLTPKDIKFIVGNRLKESKVYRQMLEPEGKRCWTIQYDEFHMDILPCVPKEKSYIPFNSTTIRLSHKLDNGEYISKYSDPEAYHNWFVDRMHIQEYLVNKKSAHSKKDAEIGKVPAYKRRTILQKAIQILKRHRDIMFQNNNENAPISIIITTLAAMAYKGEDNLFDALNNILIAMPDYIQNNNGAYLLPNPVMSEENFADKWNENSLKAQAFYNWIAAAQNDFIKNTLNISGIDTICDKLKKCIGDAPVKRAINKYGEITRNNREKGNLYINGLAGGLSIKNSSSSIRVKEHTFFGE